MKMSRFAPALAAALMLCAVPALAQGAAPEANSKKIGSWTVNCTTIASPNPCEMAQAVGDKNSGQRLLSLSFIYVPSRDQNLMVAAVPLGVSIPAGLLLKTDTFTSSKLPYHHCDRNGCYAEVPVDKNVLQTIGKSASAAVIIAADGGKQFTLPLALDGFSAANDSMVEQAKQKAKAPEPSVINGSAP